MKKFTIIYIYPEDGAIGSMVVKAADAFSAIGKAALQLSANDLGEAEIVCSIKGSAANVGWTGPACDGWKTCNVEDYLKSMGDN